jgi:hypothetical protein
MWWQLHETPSCPSTPSHLASLLRRWDGKRANASHDIHHHLPLLEVLVDQAVVLSLKPGVPVDLPKSDEASIVCHMSGLASRCFSVAMHRHLRLGPSQTSTSEDCCSKQLQT